MTFLLTTLLFILLSTFTLTTSTPLSLHQNHITPSSTTTLLTLRGINPTSLSSSSTLSAILTTLPVKSQGELYMLSNVFNTHGYEPKQGVKITSAMLPLDLSTSKNRVLYIRPTNDRWTVVGNEGSSGSDSFTYAITDGFTTSAPSTVTLLPSSNTVHSSLFNLSSEGWVVSGNTPIHGSGTLPVPVHEKSSRAGLTNYIYSTDDYINVDKSGSGSDKSQWYFSAPLSYHGRVIGTGYGGALSFKLSSFSGDFQNAAGTNNGGMNSLVIIKCDSCNSNLGLEIHYPLTSASANSWDGKTKTFTIPLTPSTFRLNPKNTLISLSSWNAPTKCEFIDIISHVSSLKVLGDFLKGGESVCLDDFSVVASATSISSGSFVPVCAQGGSDGETCSCV